MVAACISRHDDLAPALLDMQACADRQLPCSLGLEVPYGCVLCAISLCRYDLHVLLVNHGKRCPRCAKNGKPRKASDGDCPLFGSKTVKDILKEDPEDDQDSSVKQESEDDHDSLVKQEHSVDDSAVKQESIEDDHMPAVKEGSESDNDTSIKQEVDSTAAVKSEPASERCPEQHNGKDDLPKQNAPSRSTRSQVKKEGEVAA